MQHRHQQHNGQDISLSPPPNYEMSPIIVWIVAVLSILALVLFVLLILSVKGEFLSRKS